MQFDWTPSHAVCCCCLCYLFVTGTFVIDIVIIPTVDFIVICIGYDDDSSNNDEDDQGRFYSDHELITGLRKYTTLGLASNLNIFLNRYLPTFT